MRATAIAMICCAGSGTSEGIVRPAEEPPSSQTSRDSSWSQPRLQDGAAYPFTAMAALLLAFNPAGVPYAQISAHRDIHQRLGRGTHVTRRSLQAPMRSRGLSMRPGSTAIEIQIPTDIGLREWSENRHRADFANIVDKLKADIPRILHQDPPWDLFAADLTVIDQTGARVQGLDLNKQLLKLLRRVSNKFAEGIEVDVLIDDPACSGEPTDPSCVLESFPVRWKLQLGSEKFGHEMIPVDVVVDAVFHLNDDEKVDYVRIDRWLVNGEERVQFSALSTIMRHISGTEPEWGPAHEFLVPAEYDYTWSTEENYVEEPFHKGQHLFIGDYTEIRKTLDYTYHSVYRLGRQVLQDRIVNEFLHTVVVDSKLGFSCGVPEDPWIVFTAGAYGAGKTHAMTWLHSQNYFPLEAFVLADPDKIRDMLPETKQYNELDPSTMGFRTQKEANCISEILTNAALQQGKNIIVDGSLKDYEWYDKYFRSLRRRYPRLKIGIIHVKASSETVVRRAAARAKITGRMVPSEIIYESIELLPKSLSVLVPQTDFFAEIDNEESVPRLSGPANMTWRVFSDIWEMHCKL